MTARLIEARLRQFLLGLAGVLCLGTVVELALTEHTEQPLQWVPFVLCGLGLAAVAAVLVRPGRATLWGLRLTMGALLAGALLGSYQHGLSNLEIVRETHPNAAAAEAVGRALAGAAPLLAPGILAVTAAVALAATYYHPALGQRAD